MQPLRRSVTHDAPTSGRILTLSPPRRTASLGFAPVRHPEEQAFLDGIKQEMLDSTLPVIQDRVWHQLAPEFFWHPLPLTRGAVRQAGRVCPPIDELRGIIVQFFADYFLAGSFHVSEPQGHNPASPWLFIWTPRGVKQQPVLCPAPPVVEHKEVARTVRSDLTYPPAIQYMREQGMLSKDPTDVDLDTWKQQWLNVISTYVIEHWKTWCLAPGVDDKEARLTLDGLLFGTNLHHYPCTVREVRTVVDKLLLSILGSRVKYRIDISGQACAWSVLVCAARGDTLRADLPAKTVLAWERIAAK